ncbi:MAG: HAMP domain-containing histidine kinase [Acidobacteria bacterium]|nr:HAMP domain-containing histidine kinase [Acidobacteriota bacterium]
MRPARWRTWVVAALIGVSLPAIAWVQYRWMGQLSRLEQLQARTNLTSASRRFSTEFDTHLAHVYSAFHEPRLATAEPDVLVPRLRALMRQASPAGLIERAFVLDVGPDGIVHTLDVDRSEQVPLPQRGVWPAWLDRPGRAYEDENRTLPSGLQRNLLDEVPALVVPHAGHDGHRRWIVVKLDRETVVQSWLPTLLEGCFEVGRPVQYDVLISREDVPEQVIYASSADLLQTGFDDWVSRMPLFALHSLDLDAESAESLMADAAGHRWRLFVRPQQGDVEAALGAARTRNMAMSLGTLALLGLSMSLLIVSANRAERGAREQLEVVARISHELRTPLATIRCAGENLADNLVASEEDTRQYGTMIQQEAGRLTRTVQDILLSCRLQARPDSVLHVVPLDVAPVLDAAVADSRLLVGDEAASVMVTVEPGVPQVLADRDVLPMILKNLIQNALKHGAGRPVHVLASWRRSASGREIVIDVRDQGPGIPDDEVGRIFDPFFRGRDARDRQIDGSGIGLNLVRQAVESHGGRIRVSSTVGRGTTFTVHLPAARSTAVRSL